MFSCLNNNKNKLRDQGLSGCVHCGTGSNN